MRRASLLAAGLLAAAGVATGAPHHSRRSPVADPDFAFIRQAYAYEADGASHMDVNKEYEYTTDDYTASENGRVQTKADLVQQDYSAFRGIAANGAQEHESVEVLTLRHAGNSVLARVHVRLHVGVGVNDIVNGTGTVSAKVDAIEDDLWAPTTDGWACRTTVVESAGVKVHKPNN